MKKQAEHKIDELLNNSFKDFNPTPPADVWENIQANINTKPNNFFNKNITLISISAIVISIGSIVGYYNINSTIENPLITKTVNNKPITENIIKETPISNNNNIIKNNEEVSVKAVEQKTIEVKETKKENIKIHSINKVEEAKQIDKPAVSVDTTITHNAKEEKTVQTSSGAVGIMPIAKPVLAKQEQVKPKEHTMVVKRKKSEEAPAHNNQNNYTETNKASIDPFYIPNAFTPDGDGMNDYFIATKKEESEEERFDIIEFEMIIFNFNSNSKNIVFKSNNIDEGWDGTYKGEKMPPGIYTRIIKYKIKDSKGNIISDAKGGTVNIPNF